MIIYYTLVFRRSRKYKNNFFLDFFSVGKLKGCVVVNRYGQSVHELCAAIDGKEVWLLQPVNGHHHVRHGLWHDADGADYGTFRWTKRFSSSQVSLCGQCPVRHQLYCPGITRALLPHGRRLGRW